MPDTLIDSAVPAAPASPAVAPAAAPAAPSAPAAPPAPSAPAATASMTDEQIMDLPAAAPPAAPDAPDGGAAAGDASKPAEAAAAAPDAAKAAQDAPKPPAEAAELAHVPEKYREMAKSDPELAAVFSEVKAMREALPEGLKSIEELRAVKQQTEQQDAAWYSGDPAQQRSVLESMHQNDPEAFLSGFRASSQLLAERNPQAYSQVAGELVRGTLAQAGFDRFATSARQAVQDGDTEVQGQLLQEMLGWLEHNAQVGLPAEKKLEQERSHWAQREQARVEQDLATEKRSFETFNGEISRQTQEQTAAAIQETLGKLLPTAFPVEMRERIVREVQESVDKSVRGNADLQKRIGDLYGALLPPGSRPQGHKGPLGLRMTAENQKRIVEFIAGQTKALVSSAAAAILPVWTKNFVATQADKTAKAASAASRVDVQSGGAAPAAKPTDVNAQVRAEAQKLGRPLTDEEILEL